MTERVRGRIKWFSQGMRYGFIQRDGGQPDVFVHLNDFRNSADAHRLREGDRVEFEVEQALKGPKAVDVAVLKTG